MFSHNRSASKTNMVPQNIKGVLKSYGETTTIKGVPRVLKSKSYFIRVLWLLAVFFGGSFAIFQLATLGHRYYSYPTITHVKMVAEDPEFPDVTICNINPLIHGFENWSFEDYLFAIYEQDLDSLFLDGVEGNHSEWLLDYVFSDLVSMPGFLQSTPLDDLIAERERDIFIRDCLFYAWDWTDLDLRCDNTTVTYFFNEYHFLCFTISVPPEMMDKVRGLTIINYLENSEHAIRLQYNPHVMVGKSSGIKLQIHQRDTFPSTIDGEVIGPGMETTVRLSQFNVESLPHPYGDCESKKYFFEEASGGDAEAIKEQRPMLYSNLMCEFTCQQEKTIKECGCLDPVYGSSPELRSKHEDMELCGNLTSYGDLNMDNFHSEITMDHLRKVWDNQLCAMANRFLNYTCECPSACNNKYYDMSIAQAAWPAFDFQMAFWDQYIANTSISHRFRDYELILEMFATVINETYVYDFYDVIHLLHNLTGIEENFLQLNILFKERLVEKITESAAMTWDTILANVGGALNLWIGITFMTLIELAELGINLFSTCGAPTEPTVSARSKDDPASGRDNARASDVGDHTNNVRQIREAFT